MEVDDWSIHLVFELPEGGFHEEPRQYRATLDQALALARRDAASGTFGRTFRGFAKIDHASGDPRPTHSPTSPAQPLEELISKSKITQQLEERTAPESPRVDVSLEGLERLPWWHYEGAFGIASEVGLQLGRCASTDATEAEAAADRLGQLIAHQQQLFPVTVHALPWVLTLLECRDVKCRARLAQWLELITRAAVDGSDTVSTMLAWTARLVARELSDAMTSHQQAAKEVKDAMRGMIARVEALKDDPEIGERMTALIGLLG